jgi:hypothetical protein
MASTCYQNYLSSKVSSPRRQALAIEDLLLVNAFRLVILHLIETLKIFGFRFHAWLALEILPQLVRSDLLLVEGVGGGGHGFGWMDEKLSTYLLDCGIVCRILRSLVCETVMTWCL